MSGMSHLVATLPAVCSFPILGSLSRSVSVRDCRRRSCFPSSLLQALDPYEAALSPSDLSCLLACAAELRLTPSRAWIASCHARLAQLPWNWAPATRHCVHALVALAEMGPAALPPATWIVQRLHAMQAVLPGLEPAVLCELGMVMPSLGLHALHGVDAASGNLETDMQHMQDWMRAYCAAMLHAAKEGATSTGTEGLANSTINHASLRDVLGATLGVVCSCIDTAVLPVQNSFLDAPELNTWCMDMLYAADAHVPHAPAVQVATAWPLLVAYADILQPMLQPAVDTASAQGDSASSSPGILPSSRTSPPSSPKRTSWSSGGASWAPKAPAWPLDALSSPALAASLAAFSLPSVPSSPSWSSGSLEPEQEDEEACVLSVEGSGVGVDELACALKHVSMRMAERWEVHHFASCSAHDMHCALHGFVYTRNDAPCTVLLHISLLFNDAFG